MDTNQVTVVGTIVEGLTFSHKSYDEEFYTIKIETKRTSEAIDTINVVLSERLIDMSTIKLGNKVRITGQFRSHNDNTHLLLWIFATNVQSTSDEDENTISLTGYLCKEPVYRKTPMGREICDVLLAVNRQYQKSDYIPCIVWGRNAKYLADKEIGSEVTLKGRIQSRNYIKRLGNDEENRTAYEVSVAQVCIN